MSRILRRSRSFPDFKRSLEKSWMIFNHLLIVKHPVERADWNMYPVTRHNSFLLFFVLLVPFRFLYFKCSHYYEYRLEIQT